MLVGAGSPCTDLSRAKFGRKGLAGNRSKLVFEIERVVGLIKQIMGPHCRVFRFIENVASMDVEHLQAMSAELDMTPALIDASCITRCNRDRVYWVDQEFMVPWQNAERLKDVKRREVSYS